MSQDIEKRIVFAMSPPSRRPVTLLIGMPKASQDYLMDGTGLSHDLDLTRAGLPIKLIIFGGKDHDDVKRQLDKAMSIAGVTINDQRNRDFAIPKDPNNFPDLAKEAADLLGEIRHLAPNEPLLERIDSINTRITALIAKLKG